MPGIDTARQAGLGHEQLSSRNIDVRSKKVTMALTGCHNDITMIISNDVHETNTDRRHPSLQVHMLFSELELLSNQYRRKVFITHHKKIQNKTKFIQQCKQKTKNNLRKQPSR